MDGKRKICTIHGVIMTPHKDGPYCVKCERMGMNGHVIVATCPFPDCGESLLDIVRLISCQPSIKIGWRYTDETSRDGDHVLFVSAVWGDHTVFSETPIVHGQVLDLYCPHCNRLFPTRAYCTCGAKAVAIKSRYAQEGQAGLIQVCSRRGCPEHRKVPLEEYAAVRGLEWMREMRAFGDLEDDFFDGPGARQTQTSS